MAAPDLDIIPEMMQVSISGVYLDELKHAVDGKIDSILSRKLLSDHEKKQLTCYAVAAEYLRDKGEVRLSDVQQAAAKTDEFESVGLGFLQRGKEAGFPAKVVAALSAPTEHPGEEQVSAVMRNLHFLQVSHDLGQMFCECAALQQNRTQEWQEAAILESDRGTQRVPQNVRSFSRWYVREYDELETLKAQKSLRLPLVEARCLAASEGVMDCLKNATPAPGEQALAEAFRREIGEARAEIKGRTR